MGRRRRPRRARAWDDDVDARGARARRAVRGRRPPGRIEPGRKRANSLGAKTRSHQAADKDDYAKRRG